MRRHQKAKGKASGSSGCTGRRASGRGDGKKTKKKTRSGFQRRLGSILDLVAKARCDADDAGKRDWTGGPAWATWNRLVHALLLFLEKTIRGDYSGLAVGLQWVDALD